MRTIRLTPEHDVFIDEVLEAGEYRNASEAMRDAIRALQQRRAEDALRRLDRLRLAIEQGVAALERGDYTEQYGAAAEVAAHRRSGWSRSPRPPGADANGG